MAEGIGLTKYRITEAASGLFTAEFFQENYFMCSMLNRKGEWISLGTYSRLKQAEFELRRKINKDKDNSVIKTRYY